MGDAMVIVSPSYTFITVPETSGGTNDGNDFNKSGVYAIGLLLLLLSMI